MTLDKGFKIELFWIVSRTNNCQYCLGHQESKLLAAGRNEDRIARLDGDWSEFTPAEQAAYAFARKITFEPHMLADEDLANLKKHYTAEQIVEMLLSISWNNSINRWKEGVGVPQNPDEGGYSRMEFQGDAGPASESLPRGSYLTPTSNEFLRKVTLVAPVVCDPLTGEPTTAAICSRPPLELPDEVQRQLARCRERPARLPLVDESSTRQLMAIDPASNAPVFNWMRLLAHFPQEGVRRAQGLLESQSNSDLNPLLKAQISWIVARQDRAWYAVGHARRRLLDLGQSDDQIFALDGDWLRCAPSQQALYRVARHLATSPVVLTDAEVARAVELAGPAAVVQTVNYVTHCAAFNRITEAAGLPIEP